MGGCRSSISLPSGLLRTSGGQQEAIADKFALLPCNILYTYLPPSFTLAMSDELAQDEADAEDYDLESLQRRDLDHPGHDDDDDAATLVGGRRPTAPADDRVVFEIGDEHGSDEEDDDPNKNWRGVADDEDRAAGGTHEREGLIGAGNSRKDD